MIVKYIRNEKNEPYGCMVAVGKNRIGWSLCNNKDTFSKELGKMIATERAKREPHYVSFYRHLKKAQDGQKHYSSPKEDFYKNIPADSKLKMEIVRSELFKFEDRVDRYFK